MYSRPHSLGPDADSRDLRCRYVRVGLGLGKRRKLLGYLFAVMGATRAVYSWRVNGFHSGSLAGSMGPTARFPYKSWPIFAVRESWRRSCLNGCCMGFPAGTIRPQRRRCTEWLIEFDGVAELYVRQRQANQGAQGARLERACHCRRVF